MKILVPIKRVPDPELKVKIKDGAIDLSGASWVVNTFDEYAVETALRLRENAESGESHGEVVVVTIGPEDAAQQLRSALAMGADRAIRVDGEDRALDARVVAAALARVIEAEKPDLVVMGKHGTHVTEELLLGSVTLDVLAESRCDVLVVVDPRAAAPALTAG